MTNLKDCDMVKLLFGLLEQARVKVLSFGKLLYTFSMLQRIKSGLSLLKSLLLKLHVKWRVWQLTETPLKKKFQSKISRSALITFLATIVLWFLIIEAQSQMDL